MPGHLSPGESLAAMDPDDNVALRALNRSPHPYHHASSELPHSSERLAPPLLSSKESAPGSDSGTDADDEHFLKGLPAPKVRPHKGLRDRNEAISVSGTTTPVLSTGLGEEEVAVSPERTVPQHHAKRPEGRRRVPETVRRKKVLLRRATEVGIMMALAVMIGTNRKAYLVARVWRKDLGWLGLMYIALLALYPLRLLAWTLRSRPPMTGSSLKMPSSFDPAAMLYPCAIPVFVSLLLSVDNPAVLLPNLMLAVGAIPQQLVPKADLHASCDVLHWALSCLPLSWHSPAPPSHFDPTYAVLPAECLVLLYPLQRALCVVLHHLTTTSLLTTELQLLSISLVNVALLASSPQAQMLKALLWCGGLSVLVSCGAVIQWGIALARVPRWRFRRERYPPKRRAWKAVAHLVPWPKIRSDILGVPAEQDGDDRSCSSGDGEDVSLLYAPSRVRTVSPSTRAPHGADSMPSSSPERGPKSAGLSRRYTVSVSVSVSHAERSPRRLTAAAAATHTAAGKKRRTTSGSVRAYFKLTQRQATVRKWAYAIHVYVSLLAILVGVVRVHIQRHALGGREPIGWALGYLFGNLRWFRFQVVRANLERWILLPERLDDDDRGYCRLGWAQRMRQGDLGEATTRLVMAGWWVGILVVGLAVVLRLKDTCEVDTRRKVFHFMMVGMLLPATYVDPTFAGVALSLALAVFLILDLLRASQLPPLSRPLAAFLAPYVDGRDFRGPVVVSHIFLLVGCAIPLWLSLASLPRVGTGSEDGWEVPTREVGMVSGVVCVGLGDAAASLIGRRYGHRKWVWGGGKSLEGSAAFAAAVFLGLTAATAWLRVGQWPTTEASTGMAASASRSLACASMASLTEAVLTGGNDNVIVPVVLWTCVKALGI